MPAPQHDDILRQFASRRLGGKKPYWYRKFNRTSYITTAVGWQIEICKMVWGRWQSLMAGALALGTVALGVVLAYPQPESPAPLPPRSRVLVDQLMPSAALHRPLPVTLYLPLGTSPKSRLPVIVLLHGVHGKGRDWVDRGQIQQIADALIAAGKLPPVIIAMPSAGTSWYVNSADIGGPGNYETAIGTELPLWLARYWNARADRGGRAIAGVSMGGFGALHLAFDDPTHWVAAASLSGTFLTVVEKQATIPLLNQRLIAGSFGMPFDHRRLLEASPVTLATDLYAAHETFPAVFLGCGKRDQLHLLPELVSMAAELHGLGVPARVAVIDGGHDWYTWRQLLPQTLVFLGQQFRHEYPAVIVAPVNATAMAQTQPSPAPGGTPLHSLP